MIKCPLNVTFFFFDFLILIFQLFFDEGGCAGVSPRNAAADSVALSRGPGHTRGEDARSRASTVSADREA